jgi:hypothetical protein
VFPVSAAIGQVHGFVEVPVIGSVIGLQAIEVIMKHFHVVPDFDGEAIGSVYRLSFDQFAFIEYINSLLAELEGGGTASYGVDADRDSSNQESDGKNPDELKGGIDIFKLLKHEVRRFNKWREMDLRSGYLIVVVLIGLRGHGSHA